MLETSKILITYVLTVPVFFAIDMVWLGLIAKNYYAKQLEGLLAPTVNWPAALTFYFLYIFGIIFLAVLPAVEKESLKTAILNGAVLGGIAYATYDLTNLATLKNWPLQMVFVDILWGIVLTTSVAVASYYIAMWVK
jgi:uncharacterized membrane protein